MKNYFGRNTSIDKGKIGFWSLFNLPIPGYWKIVDWGRVGYRLWGKASEWYDIYAESTKVRRCLFWNNAYSSDLLADYRKYKNEKDSRDLQRASGIRGETRYNKSIRHLAKFCTFIQKYFDKYPAGINLHENDENDQLTIHLKSPRGQGRTY